MAITAFVVIDNTNPNDPVIEGVQIGDGLPTSLAANKVARVVPMAVYQQLFKMPNRVWTWDEQRGRLNDRAAPNIVVDS
jgi:hypothetical protein